MSTQVGNLKSDGEDEVFMMLCKQPRNVRLCQYEIPETCERTYCCCGFVVLTFSRLIYGESPFHAGKMLAVDKAGLL
jgi:hypothetical protein